MFTSLFSRRSKPEEPPCVREEVNESDDDFVILTSNRNSSVSGNPWFNTPCTTHHMVPNPAIPTYETLQTNPTQATPEVPRLSDIHDLPMTLSPLLTTMDEINKLREEVRILLHSTEGYTYQHWKYNYDFKQEEEVRREFMELSESEKNLLKTDSFTNFGFNTEFQSSQNVYNYHSNNHDHPLIRF